MSPEPMALEPCTVLRRPAGHLRAALPKILATAIVCLQLIPVASWAGRSKSAHPPTISASAASSAYRCPGHDGARVLYQQWPCEEGARLAHPDSRSSAQREQALETRSKDERLVQALTSDRQRAERLASKQGPAGFHTVPSHQKVTASDRRGKTLERPRPFTARVKAPSRRGQVTAKSASGQGKKPPSQSEAAPKLP